MKIFTRMVVSALCMVPFLAGFSAAAEESTLLVIPSKPAMVQLAFNVAKLHPIPIVSYERDAKTSEYKLFVWDAAEMKWNKISVDEYASASVFKTALAKVVLVGSDKDIPSALRDAKIAGAEVQRVPTIDIMNTINALNESLKFKNTEWEWLAKQHDLKLKDLNADRRRASKYKSSSASAEEDVTEVVPVEQPAPEVATKPAVVVQEVKSEKKEKVVVQDVKAGKKDKNPQDK